MVADDPAEVLARELKGPKGARPSRKPHQAGAQGRHDREKSALRKYGALLDTTPLS